MIPLWFLLEIPIALVLNVLHFWMKEKLLGAGLPVVWFMWPADDWRMWSTYRSEAPSRNWPVWPFFLYRSLLVVFVAVGLVGVAFWWARPV